MGLIDSATIRGAVRIELRDVETGETDIWEGYNAVVDTGLQLFHERMAGVASAVALGYMALGSGTGSFPGGATAMYGEFYRKALTSASIAANVATYKVYLTTAQASGYIRELGLTNAAASGAGVLISHIEVSPQVQKTSSKEAVITVTQTLSRA